MLARTRLAAAGFNDGQSNYRVFYQDSGYLLKESCYEESKGWYIRENCIVADDAKKFTSLAAVSWASGNEIRVYYMNNQNKILERKWSLDGTQEFGAWEPGSAVACTAPDPQTQFAAISIDEPDGNIKIRLFYQTTNRELRQTSFNSLTAKWEDAALESKDGGKFRPIRGSSLAVSAKETTRIFYLTTLRDISMIKEDSSKWKLKGLQKIRVVEKTPIAVAPPLYMEDVDLENKLVVFLISKGKLLKKFFDIEKDEFADNEQIEDDDEEDDSEGEVEEGGSMAIASSMEDDASVFYQSSPTAISEYNVIRAYEVGLGIPTSVGGDPRAYGRFAAGAVRSGWEPVAKLGLVDRQKINMMDAATRQRFTQRLTETVVQVLQIGASDSIREPVNKLSSEFGLGVTWGGSVGNNYWEGEYYTTWSNTLGNAALPIQQRLRGGVGYIISAQIGSDPISRYLYMETILELCKYVGVGQ